MYSYISFKVIKRFLIMWFYKRILDFWHLIREINTHKAQYGDRTRYDYACSKEWEYAKLYDNVRDGNSN